MPQEPLHLRVDRRQREVNVEETNEEVAYFSELVPPQVSKICQNNITSREPGIQHSSLWETLHFQTTAETKAPNVASL